MGMDALPCVSQMQDGTPMGRSHLSIRNSRPRGHLLGKGRNSRAECRSPLLGEVGDESQNETVSQVLRRVKFVQTFWKWKNDGPKLLGA